MKNSTIGKITTSKSGFPRSKFNLSHDVNTTCGWTDVQPLMVQSMLPDSKAVVGIESLVRLAPMVAPTFGDARFKTWHEFVAMSDLTRNFDALMSQTRVNRGSSSFVPTQLPFVSLFDLSCMCLIGSSCTVYRNGDGAVFDSIHSWITYNTSTDMSNLFNSLATDTGHTISDIVNNNAWNSGDAFEGADDFLHFNPLILLPEYQKSNFRGGVFIPVNRGRKNNISVYGSFGFGNNYYGGDITLEGADVIVFREYNGAGYAFAFRLSDFGKRIRKALIGAGYQMNFDNTTYLSLMPLFALHKAWYELFGLTLFENYEDTSANKILQRYDNSNFTDYRLTNVQLTPHLNDLLSFFVELGSMWYTEKTDFVNAHTASVTPNVKDARSSLYEMIDIIGASDAWSNPSQNIYSPLDSIGVDESDINKDGHYRTITQNHGQLDSELLKRLYKWTNRNSVVGQRVRDLLIQQGLADYVDECEPRFIGYDDTHIQISDVVSQSDTFDSGTDEGAILGEYGGRGLQYVDSKQFTYEAKEQGFYIVLCSVVPLAGYAQALDANVLSYTKSGFYQPEFDGLGMEANSKLLVCADSPIANPKLISGEGLTSTFGFVPRYSRFKVQSNKMNGDFSLRSAKANYEPYTLDRLFDVNAKRFNTAESGNIRSTLVNELFDVKDFPIAGNVWRYVGRYPYLVNSNRIFANVGANTISDIYKDVSAMDFSWELGVTQSDNFQVHNVVHFDYFAPMLPIEDSFETHDEGNEGKTNSSTEKA